MTTSKNLHLTLIKLLNEHQDGENQFASIVDPQLPQRIDDQTLDNIKILEEEIIKLSESEETFSMTYLKQLRLKILKFLYDIEHYFTTTELILSWDQRVALNRLTNIVYTYHSYLATLDEEKNINAVYAQLKAQDISKTLSPEMQSMVNVLLANQNNNGNGNSKELNLQDSVKTTKITFDDLCGIDVIKSNIQKYIHYTMNQSNSMFIALVGPPGTGKTKLSQAIATEFSDGIYYVLTPQNLSNPIVGVAEVAILNFFDFLSKTNYNITVVLDEMDSLFASNQIHLQSIKVTLQTQIESDALKNNICFVGNTNAFGKLDGPIQRRATVKFYVDVPEDGRQVAEYLCNIAGFEMQHVEENFAEWLILLFNDPNKRYSNASVKNFLVLAQNEYESRQKTYLAHLERSDLFIKTSSTANDSMMMTHLTVSHFNQLTVKSADIKLHLLPEKEDFINVLENYEIKYYTPEILRQYRKINENTV
jgi:SpoVK/Ycf46/Vps4 family AAA+-type ATPase